MERYFHKHYLGERVGTHHSSYGCPFSCNFCAVVGMVNKRWLPESAERVARIVQFQHDQYGADAIQFHDMDFFVSEPRTAEFAERITGLDMHLVGAGAGGRADALQRCHLAQDEGQRPEDGVQRRRVRLATKCSSA